MARGLEAERLSIYFEEIGAYQHKRAREMKSSPTAGQSSRTEDIVELEMGDEDMDDYSAFLEDLVEEPEALQRRSPSLMVEEEE